MPQQIKYLGINLTKCVQDLREKNYKTLMKNIKEQNKWKCISCSWIGRLNSVKMSFLPNLIYRFNAIPTKIPTTYFVANDKLIVKFIWRGKRPRIAKSILEEKNKVGRLALLSFNTYCEATVIKKVWYW